MTTLNRGQWTAEQANNWYDQQPYLIGANYIPASAINQLEMWQAETFDLERIDLELGWAENLGMNTMRVFLHDLLWEQDSEAFKKRIDVFLTLCTKRKIRPMLVLFDSCWDPYPKLGLQRAPVPGVHNSGWVQGPGSLALTDISQHGRLERYVKGVVGAFAQDARVLLWDVWNEPDNLNHLSYGDGNLEKEPSEKTEYVEMLLPKVFEWVRDMNPTQPLTSGLWRGDWAPHESLEPIHKIQIEYSDVLSFHNYELPEIFENRARSLMKYNRPLLCTEYMARGMGNTFNNIISLAKGLKIAAINWGFVAGKSQTFLPWDSWQKPYVDGHEPEVWFHDIFYTDGRPYRISEMEVFKA